MKRKHSNRSIRVSQQVQRKNKTAVGGHIANTEEPPVTQPLWQVLQRSLGNRATERLLLSVQPRNGGMERNIYRQAAEEETVAAVQPASSISPARLGLSGELPGHADQSIAQSSSEGSATVIQLQPAAASTGAEVALSVLAPQEDHSKTAAQIAAAHSKPGIAGWTTPRYQITVSDLKPFHMDVDVTVGFKIELAKEYTSTTLQVLRDHEQGHVNIGAEQAQQHLQVDLKNYLEGLLGFTNPSLIQQGFVNAASVFGTDEGNESKTYDDMDYPRMEQAYQGAKTPLGDLEKNLPTVATLAQALREFKALKPPLARKEVPVAVQTVLDACDALSEDEKSMLQYNPVFKALVDQATVIIGLWSVWLDRTGGSDSAITGKLDLLTTEFGGFDWKPPV